MTMSVRDGARIMVVALALVFVAGAMSVTAPSAVASWVDDWNDEPALGVPASQAVVVSGQDGMVYIMGGVTDASYIAVDSAYSYDPYTGDWTVLDTLPDSTRGAAGAVGQDGLVYVFGGDGTSTYTQIYDPEADSWSLGAPMLAGAWEAKAATVGNGSIWVVGGAGGGYAQIYDPVEDSWSVGTPAPASVMCGAMISIGDDLYYSGGGDGNYDGTTNFFKYDAAEDEWATLADLPEARAGHAMVMGADGLIYLVGGSDNGYNWGNGVVLSSVVAYDLATDEWSSATSMDVPRTYLGAVVTSDGRILALGGNSPSTILDVVESLQLYLFEYSASLSSDSVKAGGSVLLRLDAEFTYIEEHGSEVYWYLMCDDDDTVYNSDGLWTPSNATLGIAVEVPAIAPVGNYSVVVDYWYVYADVAYETMYDIALPLKVLPAASTTEDVLDALDELDTSQTEIIEDLNDTISDLQDQLDAQDDKISSLEDKAASASMWAMLTMVLVVVVLVLLALMFMMGRKKAA
jgi:uncharacterized coiled-coil protein SlyX